MFNDTEENESPYVHISKTRVFPSQALNFSSSQWHLSRRAIIAKRTITATWRLPLIDSHITSTFINILDFFLCNATFFITAILWFFLLLFIFILSCDFYKSLLARRACIAIIAMPTIASSPDFAQKLQCIVVRGLQVFCGWLLGSQWALIGCGGSGHWQGRALRFLVTDWSIVRFFLFIFCRILSFLEQNESGLLLFLKDVA